MFWLTWRQYRRTALAWLADLAVLAAVLVPTGLTMRHTFDRLGLDRCTTTAGGHVVTRPDVPGCSAALQQFDQRFGIYGVCALLLIAFPLLFGLFWGPALVAGEVEHGTHRFVWTQGVSRRTWAAVRFGLVGGVVTVLAIGYALAVNWWYEPFHRTGQDRFGSLVFDVPGVVAVGHTLFAVAFGILAGALLRRTGPAMAATLGGYLAVRIAVARWGRPSYLPPLVVSSPTQEGVDRAVAPDDWTIVSAVKDAGGRILHTNGTVSCAGPGCGDFGPGASTWVLFQPASRYWTFQWIETGVFTALAATLVLLALHRLRRIA